MMSLNRYKLRHLSHTKHKGAVRANKLLERPDRLIGIILLGNNFVNILASSITTILALRLLGEAWIAFAAGCLTLVILIFAEVAPKTMAALHPEQVAFPTSLVLRPLLTLFYPAVWVINIIANSLLKVFGISSEQGAMHQLSSDELRTVVNEAGAMIPKRHQNMLLNILDLEKATIEDIMIPRNDIIGIDLNSTLENIVTILKNSQHTKLPVYNDDIDNVVGILHVRNALPLLAKDAFDKEALVETLEDTYFVPQGTPLNTQLLNFQRHKKRTGLVVDEYGDIEGLIALEDILEEIVGEFTTDVSSTLHEVHPQEDGSYLIDGGINIRELNRVMKWDLPTKGPKTLNGLILEYLESIPSTGTSIRVSGYPIEIIKTADNTVKIARVLPNNYS